MGIKLDIPENKSGDWSISHFSISKEKASLHNVCSFFGNIGSDRSIVPGDYVKLMYRNDVVMSNTSAEIRDHTVFINQAKGDVLINGLGLGMVIKAILPNVDSITVIEKSEDVINMVGPCYDDPKITIIHADAYEYKPPKGVRYDSVWNDIWTFISVDNLEGMHKLHRKYGRRSDWIGSWCRSECEYKRARDNSYGY